jgi:hypothetical protein
VPVLLNDGILHREGIYLAHESRTHGNHRAVLWVVALVVILTTLVLDVGALAWSASVLDGRQVTAGIFTFLLVVSGGAITVWMMKVG